MNNSRLSRHPARRVTRARPVTALAATLLLTSAACARQASVVNTPGTARSTTVDSAHVYALVSALADDSMQGRRTGTPGGARAARWIAGQMQSIGLTPAGDSGFYQRVPLFQIATHSWGTGAADAGARAVIRGARHRSRRRNGSPA